MSVFDNTEEEYINEKIANANTQPMLASVKKVVEHTSDDDYSNFECDVITAADRQQLRDVPVMVSGRGMIEIPRVGDTVIVTKLSGRGERYIIIGTVHTRQDRAPIGEAGIIRYKRGNIYFEIDAEGEWIRLSHKNNDDDNGADANAVVEIDDSGSDPIINLSGKTVNIESEDAIVNSQSVKLGDSSGTFKRVAREGDTVEVDDPKSGTISGTITSGSSKVESS